MKKQLSTLLLGLMVSAAASASDLVIKVVGVNSDEGTVRLGLYDKAKGFGKEKKAITVQEALASTDPVVIRISDLPAGDYAVFAFHDSNADRKFDHLLGMLPSEGYGFSVNNDLKAEENFKNSLFSHSDGADTEVTVYMRYCGTRTEKSVGKMLSCWMSLSP